MSAHDRIPDTADEYPTSPTPLLSGEGRLLHRAIKDLGSQVLHVSRQVAESDRKVDALHEDFGGVVAALSRLEGRVEAMSDRDEDTGRHIIQLAEGIGEAKGMAKHRRASDPPAIVFLVRAGAKLSKHMARWWAIHLAASALTAWAAWSAWLSHHIHWSP